MTSWLKKDGSYLVIDYKSTKEILTSTFVDELDSENMREFCHRKGTTIS